MSDFNAYFFVIGSSIIIILSYFFNLISKKTNIPSVLLLIVLGIILQYVLKSLGRSDIDFFPILEVFGIIGLILIVLEAALDLNLTADKWPIIWKSFLIAFISLLICTFLFSFVLMMVLKIDLFIAMVYSIPLSILSSAIIIPSVHNLSENKKEFMIYESSFSDILGIMFFYFLLGNANSHGFGEVFFSISKDIIITIVVSLVLSYLLLFLFQNIKTSVKLFLLLAVLVLLYSIGKLFHLSSLIIILVFGLLLQNRQLFFRGKLKKWLNEKEAEKINANFKMITIESSFVVRTFFFVIFGVTIALSSLFHLNVILISIILLILMYGIRFLLFWAIFKKDFTTELFIAPRGLITILLFYAIPKEYQVAEFEDGILLFIILITAIIMAVALVKQKKKSDNMEINNMETDQDYESVSLTNDK